MVKGEITTISAANDAFRKSTARISRPQSLRSNFVKVLKDFSARRQQTALEVVDRGMVVDVGDLKDITRLRSLPVRWKD